MSYYPQAIMIQPQAYYNNHFQNIKRMSNQQQATQNNSNHHEDKQQPITKQIADFSYNLDDILGKGEFSTVHKGINVKTNENVAIKVVELQKISQPIFHILINNEMAILQQIKHKNTLQLKGVFRTLNNIYIVTEYCNQGDLGSLIQKRKQIPEQQVIKIMKHLINGVKYLQEAQIIHRDIKPANILVMDGIPKIADFGFAISKTLSADQQDALKSFSVGTPLYMAPEILLHNKYTFKTDIWALGAVFYEMLFGQVPFMSTQHPELVCKVKQYGKTNIIPDLQNSQFSQNTKDIITRMLAFEPEKRITIPELIDHFSDCLKQPIIVQLPYQIKNTNSFKPGRQFQSNTMANPTSILQMKKDNINISDEGANNKIIQCRVTTPMKVRSPYKAQSSNELKAAKTFDQNDMVEVTINETEQTSATSPHTLCNVINNSLNGIVNNGQEFLTCLQNDKPKSALKQFTSNQMKQVLQKSSHHLNGGFLASKTFTKYPQSNPPQNPNTPQIFKPNDETQSRQRGEQVDNTQNILKTEYSNCQKDPSKRRFKNSIANTLEDIDETEIQQRDKSISQIRQVSQKCLQQPDGGFFTLRFVPKSNQTAQRTQTKQELINIHYGYNKTEKDCILPSSTKFNQPKSSDLSFVNTAQQEKQKLNLTEQQLNKPVQLLIYLPRQAKPIYRQTDYCNGQQQKVIYQAI